MSRIQELAENLLRDGYVDNEPDAYLAAIYILSAADRTSSAPRDGEVCDGRARDAQLTG